MKYCQHCGGELVDDAVVCIHCGRSVVVSETSEPTEEPNVNTYQQTQPVAKQDDGLDIVIKIFMILGCISSGWLIIPLAWTIPMTVSCFRKMDKNEPIGTGFKVCVLIFQSLIAGICLLCRKEEK